MTVLVRTPTLEDAAEPVRVHQQYWVETCDALVPAGAGAGASATLSRVSAADCGEPTGPAAL